MLTRRLTRGTIHYPSGRRTQVDGAAMFREALPTIDRYVWEWMTIRPMGQGSATTTQCTYNVRLTVRGDSSHSAIVRVEVRDVDPVVNEITTPEQTYEIARMTYEVDAMQVRLVIRLPGTNGTLMAMEIPSTQVRMHLIDHQFHDAGRYNLIITVLDGDSQFQEVRPVRSARDYT